MIIYRKKINEALRKYKYHDKNDNPILNKKILDYINSLVIPPAYDKVEIFYIKSPKILYQGYDKAGRLQQIYSPKWRAKADKEKFRALIDFGYQMPNIMKEMQKHINSKKPTKEKIIALILRITSICGFRHGSIKYKTLYGSIGLITLDPTHIQFKTVKRDGKPVKVCDITFTGKKGVKNECVFDDKVLINELEKLVMDRGKKEYIFQYIDRENKVYKHITAIDINNWLKSYNPEFTAKFFRTFDVNTRFIELTNASQPTKLTEQQRRKMVTAIIKDLACQINNTATVCKKSYVNPELIQLYIEHPKKYTDTMIKTTGTSYIKFIRFLESIYK